MLSLREFTHRLGDPGALAEEAGAAGGIVAVVDLGKESTAEWSIPSQDRVDPSSVRAFRTLPGVVIGVTEAGEPPVDHNAAQLTDVLVTPARLDRLESAIAARPKAAVALALLLRADHRMLEDGLVAESTAYSMLQAGPEFGDWLAGRPPGRPQPDEGPPVTVDREGNELAITLARPHRHNALNAAMRDALAEALRAGLADPSVTVVLRGDGKSFCSGGDLAEFGTAPDPATSHLVRLTRSPAALAARLGPRLVAHVHGACMGAGIELAAFASKIEARPDAFFALPELSLGLIPGSGGTVSLRRRIGRHRTAWLAFTGERIDAAQALAWGLIDGLS